VDSFEHSTKYLGALESGEFLIRLSLFLVQWLFFYRRNQIPPFGWKICNFCDRTVG